MIYANPRGLFIEEKGKEVGFHLRIPCQTNANKMLKRKESKQKKGELKPRDPGASTSSGESKFMHPMCIRNKEQKQDY